MSPRRDDYLDDGTGIGVRQAQTSAQFGDSLPHSADPDSHAFRSQLTDLLFDSLAIVANRNGDAPIIFRQSDRSIPRSGMPEHIGQGFLDDAEDRGFQLRLEPAEIGGIDLQANVDSAAF